MVETNVQVVQSGSVQQKRKREKGFTLIEMMAVVIILAIVAGVGFVVVNKQVDKAKQNTDVANVRVIADAVQRYTLENNTVYSSGTTIITVDDLVTQSYLAQKPADPWGGTGVYTISVPTGTKDVTITGVKPADTITLKNVITP